MNAVFAALLTILGTVLGGCSTAGPFITNVAADGLNGLAIEKCTVQFNAFLYVVSTGQCTTSHITVK